MNWYVIRRIQPYPYPTNLISVKYLVAFSGMMWNVWGLIIFGGAWDAATSIRLRNAESDRCLTVIGQQMVRISSCRAAASDAQTWLWEGKRLQNKKFGQCLGVLRMGGDHTLHTCPAPKGYNDATEFIRWGEHGLKTSQGKCLKITSWSRDAMQFGNCTEDKDDPYYE
jgi:hypothetical protein